MLKCLLESLEASSPSKNTNNKRGSSSSNTFRDVMGKFYSSSEAMYEKLDARFKKAQASFEKAVSLFGEDPKIMGPDEFFGIFWGFCAAYQSSKAENLAAIKKEEELKKREAERKVFDCMLTRLGSRR